MVKNPRHFIVALDQLDDKSWRKNFVLRRDRRQLRLVAGLFYKDQKAFIQEHEYYPG